ncbi:MAG: Fe-S cluster assembly protein SufD [Ancalomicrobiaceae bacterium]|nr:Fe-S cluster assembly protein SufD [Ancalomicrobiaceae bacterium]
MTSHSVLKTPAEVTLARQFEEAVGDLPGTVAVRDLREAAFARFAAKGLPHRRVEEWKYTDLKARIAEAAPLAVRTSATALAEVAARPREIDGAIRLFVVDGTFHPEISDLAGLPEGLSIAALADVLDAGREDVLAVLTGLDIAKEDAALALNTAFLRDGVVIDVADGAAIAAPVEIVHVVTPAHAVSVHSRVVVILGTGAKLGLVERFVSGDAGHQRSEVLQVITGDGAELDHAAIKSDDRAALGLSTLTATLGSNAKLASFGLNSSGDLSRRQFFVRFDGDHAALNLSGANLLSERMHSDVTLVVEHVGLAGVSRELYRYVIDGEASGVFQGKVIVRPGAQKTDGRMASNALLLSDTAEMANKPELEIYADDVACGHGATCGAIDETPVFYLMSRGLPRADAEALLIRSFVGEVVDGVAIGALEPAADAVRQGLDAAIDVWLAGRSLGVAHSHQTKGRA